MSWQAKQMTWLAPWLPDDLLPEAFCIECHVGETETAQS